MISTGAAPCKQLCTMTNSLKIQWYFTLSLDSAALHPFHQQVFSPSLQVWHYNFAHAEVYLLKNLALHSKGHCSSRLEIELVMQQVVVDAPLRDIPLLDAASSML